MEPNPGKPFLREELGLLSFEQIAVQDAIIARHCISLQAAEESGPWISKSDERRNLCLGILNRYYRQIRYGCQSSSCHAPRCLTYQKKNAKSPFRRHAVLSARALAFSWASEDNPSGGLCSHLPDETSSSWDTIFSSQEHSGTYQSQGILDLPSRQKDIGSDDVEGEMNPEIPQPLEDVPKAVFRQSNKFEPSTSQTATETKSRDGMKARDNKSLVQNLFDTKSVLLAGGGACSAGRQTLGSEASIPDFDKKMSLPRLVGRMDTYLAQATFWWVKANPQLNSGQVLGHFASENIHALCHFRRIMNEQPNAEDFGRSMDRTKPIDPLPGSLDPITEVFKSQKAFLRRSLTYILSTPVALLKSFRYGSTSNDLERQTMKEDILNLHTLDYHPKIIYSSLWKSLEHIFSKSKPHQIIGANDNMFGTKYESSDNRGWQNETDRTQSDALTAVEAAHVFKISLTTLVASFRSVPANIWGVFVFARKRGFLNLDSQLNASGRQIVVELMQTFEDEMAVRLMARIVRSFSSRCGWNFLSQEQNAMESKEAASDMHKFLQPISSFLSSKPVADASLDLLADESEWMPRTPIYSVIVLEWARTVLVQEWDGKPEFTHSSTFGCAVAFISFLYKNRSEFALRESDFQTDLLSEQLDLDVPVNWLSSSMPRGTSHILSFPFLIPPRARVTYFRAINYTSMFKAFESSMTTSTLAIRMGSLAGRGEKDLFDRLKIAMATYLVLEIRRESILTDALNQLWRRQKRELQRPLKVRMGMDEGEEGVDHGGVQQEFFRIALGEALNPDYGLFTMDDRTRISWFRPCSLEPLYKFELLGLLASLAVYNGLTLPITFPTVLYRKLLGLQVTKLSDIEDGWPDLCKGLNNLLSWSDGSVEDVFVRSYVFGFETIGANISVDINKHGREEDWPVVERVSCQSSRPWKGKGKEEDIRKLQVNSVTPSSKLINGSHNLQEHRTIENYESSAGSDGWEDVMNSDLHWSASCHPTKLHADGTWSASSSAPTNATDHEPEMVTNDNREQYVDDYIFWLTDKSIRPQFEAFAKGFNVCLDRKALSLFTPESLKRLIEGSQDIDINELERTTTYDYYTPRHRVIRDFWKIVRNFSPDEVRKLLEFTTASDRIPVNGIGSILFVVQRNGNSDDRLPTSLTCFGRLLLPEYSTKEILEERLRMAIDNSRGFGVA